MKALIYASLAAAVAMVTTSGIVALATAPTTAVAEPTAQTHLDTRIAAQLDDVKQRLGLRMTETQ